MFTTIQPHERASGRALIDASFRLRKRVFHDRLGWDVAVEGERERDRYDALDASYLVWTDPKRKSLYGAVRLMPMDGPTLLGDVFHATQAADPVPRRRDVWEGTRMCVDEEAIARDMPGLGAGTGMDLLLLALCEAALAHRIARLVSNYEAPMSRVYRRVGLSYHAHGKADGYGARPVHCASFEVSAKVLEGMRERLGMRAPLFTPATSFAPLVPAPCPAAIDAGSETSSLPLAA